MATRQYIGARYVPIFGRKGETSIEWDNSAPYEPLTMVQHEGDTYISKQIVPAGVDILNQTYWAKIGAFNAQVEALTNRVIAMESQIINKISKINDKPNSAYINNAEDEISTLNFDTNATGNTLAKRGGSGTLRVGTPSNDYDAVNLAFLYNSIIDNLTSTETQKSLSAKQGKILKGLIDDLVTDVTNLSTNVDDLTTAVNTLSGNVGTLSGNVNTLSGNVETLTDNVEEIEEKITGVEKKTLLWENASPTSAFYSQTINIDVRSYKRLFIDFIYWSGNILTQGVTFEKNPSGMYSGVCYFPHPDTSLTGNVTNIYRAFRSNSEGKIIFDNTVLAYSANITSPSDKAIPYKIYGIKEN